MQDADDTVCMRSPVDPVILRIKVRYAPQNPQHMGKPAKPGLLRVVVGGNVDAGNPFRGPRLHERAMGRPALDQQDQPVFADEWLQVDPVVDVTDGEPAKVYYRIPNIVEKDRTVTQLPMEHAVNFCKVPLDNSDAGEPNKRGSDPLPTNILYVRLQPKTERDRNLILEDAMASFTDNQDAGGGIDTLRERRVRFLTVEVYAYEYDGTGYPWFEQNGNGEGTNMCETNLQKWPLGVPWRVLQVYSSFIKLDFRWHNLLLEQDRANDGDVKAMQANAKQPVLTEQARWHVRAVFEWKDHPAYKDGLRKTKKSAKEGGNKKAREDGVEQEAAVREIVEMEVSKAVQMYEASMDKYQDCTGAVTLWKRSPAASIGYNLKLASLGAMRLRPAVDTPFDGIDGSALRNTWAAGDPLQVGGDMWLVDNSDRSTFATRLAYSSTQAREYQYQEGSAGFQMQKQQLQALRDVQFLRVKVFQEAEESYKQANPNRSLPSFVGKQMIASATEADFNATDGGAKEVILCRALQWAQSRYFELSMYVCNVEPGRLLIDTENEETKAGKKMQTEALKHRLCAMRNAWLKEQEGQSTSLQYKPTALKALKNPIPFSHRVTDESLCKDADVEDDIMKMSYSGDALVYQLLWYVPQNVDGPSPPTGEEAWVGWQKHMHGVINANTWIAKALVEGPEWRTNYVSKDGTPVAGEPPADQLQHIRLPTWWNEPGNSPSTLVRNKSTGSKWYRSQKVKTEAANGAVAKVEIDGVMWKRNEWICAMRSFLTMSHVYPEVWHMLQSITKEYEGVQTANENTKSQMKKDATTRFVAEEAKRRNTVDQLKSQGKAQEALALQNQPPFDPERATLLERIKSWSTSEGSGSASDSAPSPAPTMMVMRHRGSMPRHARLLPRA